MKHPRDSSDGGLTEESPSVKKRTCERPKSSHSPSQAIETTEPNKGSDYIPNQVAEKNNSPAHVIDPDSAVDLSYNQEPDHHKSPSREPPETCENQDWNSVYEGLERLRRERLEKMDQEAYRRALLRSVQEPSNIRQLMDFRQTILKEDRCPPPELELATEDLTSLKEEFGADVLSRLELL